MKNNYLGEIEGKLELYFGKKAPAMPENIKEMIVKYSPYISIIVIILCLPALLTSFGLSAVVMPFTYLRSFHSGFSFSISALVLIASMVFEFMAIPGLFKRSKQSWKYMFYASLLSLLSSLLDLDLGSVLISGIISFYVLFQIKSYYKN